MIYKLLKPIFLTWYNINHPYNLNVLLLSMTNRYKGISEASVEVISWTILDVVILLFEIAYVLWLKVHVFAMI